MDAPTASVLTELLRSRLGPEWRCTALERAESGNAQEIWFLDAAGPDGAAAGLVLRRSAAAGSLAHTDRGREAAVLRALAASGLPVPRVCWAEEDGGVLRRPYLVMERLPGRPPAADDPAPARELGGLLARLHALDGALLPGGEGLGAAAATARELAAWRRRHEESGDLAVPRLDALFDWLEANPPDRAGVAARVLWGDPGPHNLLVEDGRVAALLDWELWHHGDPLEDLGAALWAGRGPARDALLAGYEELAGPLDRAALAYFEALACATRSVMLLAGIAAFLGERPRPSAAGLGQHLLLANLDRAAALTGAGPDPAAAGRGPYRLRPDPSETADGVAGFLAAELLPTVADRRLRRELKVAVALLRDAARRARQAEPEPADPAAQRRLIPNLAALYEGRSTGR